MTHPHVDALLDGLVGQRVTGIARILYLYLGELDSDEGPLELEVERGTYLFTGQSDGQTLRLCSGAWVDPFAEPLSDENRQFVETHGKWTRVRASSGSSSTATRTTCPGRFPSAFEFGHRLGEADAAPARVVDAAPPGTSASPIAA